jgi:hypothetical protein
MFRTEDVIRLTTLIMAEEEMVTKEITQIVRSLTEIAAIQTDMKWITIEKLKQELLAQEI